MRWVILTAAVFAASRLLDGIVVSGFVPVALAAAVLGVLNALLRPLIILLTLPINILTFGLFTFVINALMLKMASAFIDGFEVLGFWTAIGGALIIGVVSWLLNLFVGSKGRVEKSSYIDLQHKGGRWQ